MARGLRYGFVMTLALLPGAVLNPPVAHAQGAATEDAVVESAAPPGDATEAEQPVAGYDHGFFIRAPDAPYALRLQARLQARYTAELVDGADDEMAFAIQRARLKLDGHAFTEALEYELQLDFGRGDVVLKDFYVDWAVDADWLVVRVGQFKRPFSRQHITSSGRLELVDRAPTDGFFDAGRDLGLMLHNDYTSAPPFEYAFGVFNGTGDSPRLSGTVVVDPATGEGEITSGRRRNVPAHFHPALVLRVGYNYGGIRGYSEADLEGGPFRFAVAGSVRADLDTDDDDESGVLAEVDVMAKVAHFSATGGVYLGWVQDGESFGDQTFDALGAFVQLGYVIAETVQPVLRYTRLAPDGDDDDVQEIGGGLAVYFFGHGLKWQSDAYAVVSEQAGGDDTTDWLLRTQLQLAF